MYNKIYLFIGPTLLKSIIASGMQWMELRTSQCVDPHIGIVTQAGHVGITQIRREVVELFRFFSIRMGSGICFGNLSNPLSSPKNPKNPWFFQNKRPDTRVNKSPDTRVTNLEKVRSGFEKTFGFLEMSGFSVSGLEKPSFLGSVLTITSPNFKAKYA